MSRKLPWLRLYTDITHDDKIKLLAFEDRWHFIAFLCMKSDGLLDEPESDLKNRRIAVNLGVQLRELDEIKRRLCDVGLLDKDGHPKKWDDLQFKSDSSSERVRNYREKQRLEKMKRDGNVTVTPQDSDTDSESDQYKDQEKKPSPPNKVRFVAKNINLPIKIDQESWIEWCEFRSSKNKPVSEKAAKKQIEMLAGYSIQDQREIIQQSITNDYQGLFPPKRGTINAKSRLDRQDDALREYVRQRSNNGPVVEAHDSSLWNHVD